MKRSPYAVEFLSGLVLLFAFTHLVFATRLNATEPPITDLAFAPDATEIVAVSQLGVRVLNWPELQPQRAFDSSAANLHCIAFSPNGKLLAVGGGNPSEQGIVEIFSWPAGEKMKTINEHEDSVMSIAWLSDSQLFTAGLDRQIHRCEVAPQQTIGPTPTHARATINQLEGHSRGVTSLGLLNDNTTLVSAGDDQSLRVWNASTGELLRSLSQHTKPIHAVVVRPGEIGLPMVATAADDRTIRFWQPTIGRMVRYIRLTSEPLDVAWTNDGTQIVAACADGHVRVVDPTQVVVMQDIPAIDGWAYSIAVHPSDRGIAVAGSAGQIKRIVLTEFN
jgi:WD40 repeat protein